MKIQTLMSLILVSGFSEFCQAESHKVDFSKTNMEGWTSETSSKTINYSKKILFQGDALYFKKPDFIVKNHKNPALDIMKLISMLITFYHFSDALSILNDKKLYKLLCTVYNESKISNLGNEIREFSEKFNLHNKVFLREYKLRKYVYKDRDNLYH